MKKIFVITALLFTSLFANSAIEELGISKELLNESSFKLRYNELSSPRKVQYYDNIIKKSSLNAKIVREELEVKQLPSSLFFIPLIESSYVNQINKKGPSGLWQIIPATATTLKLRRNEFVDERLDLIKSTDAAIGYLKKYYKKFGKWYLSAMAYNAGEGRIIHGIARATLDNYLDKNPTMYHDKVIKVYNLYINDYAKNKKGLDNLYTIYKDLGVKHGYFDYVYLLKYNSKRDYLPKTTVNYINMLASFSILADANKFKHLERETKYDLEKVTATKGLKLKTIADALSMSYDEIKTINKHLLKDIIPTDKNSYNFYIPHTKVELFNSRVANIKGLVSLDDKESLEKIQKNTKNQALKEQKDIGDTKKASTTYKVEKGDTLEAIAKKYKISLKKLKNDNKKSDNKLKIGEKLEIYK